jgi:hypothetical protein
MRTSIQTGDVITVRSLDGTWRVARVDAPESIRAWPIAFLEPVDDRAAATLRSGARWKRLEVRPSMVG